MFRDRRSIFNLCHLNSTGKVVFALCLCFASAAAFSGCATASDQLKSRLKIGEPVARVFTAKYEDVEIAVKQAMIKYPQRIDNTEAGIFESDYVKGDQRFVSPAAKNELPIGYRYRILIRLIRGKVEGTSVVKVAVTKHIELARDFFSQPDPVASDGLEEAVILYRIGRELDIARQMAQAANKPRGKKP